MPKTDLSEYTFPKRYEDGDDHFPMLHIDVGDDMYRHPVVDAINNGGKIESVEMVGDEWYDDHCPCCDVDIVVDGKKYGFSAWWLSSEGFKMIVRAECGQAKRVDELREFIVDHATDEEIGPMPQEVIDQLT